MHESPRCAPGYVSNPGYNEGFFIFQKMDFYFFLFNFQRQLTRVTLTVSTSSVLRNKAALAH